jgi:YD repeat-containing protein
MFRETWKDLHSDVQAIIASATRGAVPQGVFGANFPLGFTYDAVGNELTYKNNDGYSSEYTYDANGNQLTFENSNGYSCEFIYDDNDGLVIKNTSSNL